jgi:hypothetical protein
VIRESLSALEFAADKGLLKQGRAFVWQSLLTLDIALQASSKRLLSVLQIAGRHLARLVVALEFKADLLAFDQLAHSGALDSGYMNEGVSAAIVRLDEAEALGGIEPFYCASGHDEPFQSIE